MKSRGRFSLRARLLFAVVFAVTLALTIASFATRASLRRFLIARVDRGLTASTREIGHRLNDRFRFDQSGDQLREAVPDGTYVQILSSAGTVEQASIVGRAVQPADVPRLVVRATKAALFGTAPSAQHGASPFRTLQTRMPDGRLLVVAVSLRDESSTLQRLANIEVVVALSALGVAAAAGWAFVRIGLRPLREVERTATAIAQGDMDRRVPSGSAQTELSRLTNAFNTMLDRIQAAFTDRDRTEDALRLSEERMRRFVGDASHELRTPLAAVAAYTELFGLGARDHPDDLERTMHGIRKETARMGDLVQDLLALARMDDGHPAERRPVELVSVAADAVHAAGIIDPSFPVSLIAPVPIDMLGDTARLRQVFDNLLANVRAHTPPGTHTHFTLNSTADQVTIRVADNGPGMTDEQASQIFERFYRADPSRSRRSGGAGLGLSIVEAIIRSHGGRLHVESAPGAGAAFVIDLPCDSPTH